MTTEPEAASTAAARYALELEGYLGRKLVLIHAASEAPGYITAAARTVPSGTSLLGPELALQILGAPDETGAPAVWTLIFVFVRGERVTSATGDYLVTDRNAIGEWRLPEWRRDEFEEWTDVELPEMSSKHQSEALEGATRQG